jgi:hypothetical protein
MLYDEEFILLSDSRLIKDSLFHTFSVINAFWNNFLWLNYKVLIMEKRIIRLMLQLRQMTSYRQKFKKLQISTVPSLYIIEIYDVCH